MDDVRGIIIGSIQYAMTLYYDGRSQSQTYYYADEKEGIKAMKNRIERKKREFPWCYQDEKSWEIRIS